MLAKILGLPIRFYQRFISPLFPPSCRYYPSCSTYFLTSLETHGAFKGFLLGSWRVLRCNPWSRGGVDHVPPRGSWSAPPWVPPDDWVGHSIQGKPVRKFWKKSSDETVKTADSSLASYAEQTDLSMEQRSKGSKQSQSSENMTELPTDTSTVEPVPDYENASEADNFDVSDEEQRPTDSCKES